MRGLPGRRDRKDRNAFLLEMFVPCDVCHGNAITAKRWKSNIKGKNIYDVLNMTVEEAWLFTPPRNKQNRYAFSTSVATSAWGSLPQNFPEERPSA